MSGGQCANIYGGKWTFYYVGKNVIVEQCAPGGRIQTFREKLMFFYVGTKCHCNAEHKIKGQTVTAFGRPNIIRVEVSLSDELSYFLCQNVLFWGGHIIHPF